MYKAVVFDMDGTLVDSPLCFTTMRQKLGVPEEGGILEHLAELPLTEQRDKMVLLEEMELAAARKAVPFPHAMNVIKQLRLSGVKTGIFTRNCRVATDQVVNSLGIEVDLVLTREDAPPKPDPAGLLKFMRSWGVPPTDLLFVGDYLFDIECGKKAGVRTALFTNGEVDTSDWKPDHVLTCFSKFSHLLDARP